MMLEMLLRGEQLRQEIAEHQRKLQAEQQVETDKALWFVQQENARLKSRLQLAHEQIQAMTPVRCSQCCRWCNKGWK